MHRFLTLRRISSHVNLKKDLVPAFSGLPFLDFFGVVSRWECDDFNAKQDWVLWKLGFFNAGLSGWDVWDVRTQTKVEMFEMIIMILGIIE